MIRLIFLSFFFLSLVLFTNSKIHCEYQPSKWVKNKVLKLSQRQWLVSTIYGVDVIIDGKDGAVSRIIYETGQWEATKLRNIAKFVKKGQTILNVGSHIGLEAVVLGKVIGQTGRLFIFQPYSVSFNMVLKNVHLNDLGDIATVYNVGAGNKKTKGLISVQNTNTGASAIYTDPSIARGPQQTEQVPVDLVDDVLPQDAVIDVALIDVERMEIQCLQGMKKTILRSPNIIIMSQWAGVSYNTRNIRQYTKELLLWFEQHKFKFYLFDKMSKDCKYSFFRLLDINQVLALRGILDIYFIPSHIDPNIVEY